MPGVSVVIPAFNAAHTIGEALASVRAQTLRDVEVIVVDDGSTDATLDAAGRFAGDLDLVLVRQPNSGPSVARNAGVRRARGRYCAFLDADDRMLPERLGAQAALLDQVPEHGLVHCDLMTFDQGGIIHRTRRAFSDPRGGRVLEWLVLDNFITTSTVMARREALVDAGLFNEERRLSEDFELWLRVASRWSVGYLEQPLVQYRRSPGSLSCDKLATALAALDVIGTFWREHPDFDHAHPGLRRRSLARHRQVAGSAALAQGARGAAVGHLARALVLEPLQAATWKSLAKSLLPSGAGHQARRPLRGEEST